MFPSPSHLDRPAVAQSWRAPLVFARVAATRELVRARTRELAIRAGRDPVDVTQSDYEQAKREVTGEAEHDRQEAILDTIPPPPSDPIAAAEAPVAPSKTTPPTPFPALP